MTIKTSRLLQLIFMQLFKTYVNEIHHVHKRFITLQKSVDLPPLQYRIYSRHFTKQLILTYFTLKFYHEEFGGYTYTHIYKRIYKKRFDRFVSHALIK